MTRHGERNEIELFLQGEGIAEITLVRVPRDGTTRDIIEAARARGLSSPGGAEEPLVLVEDTDEPLPADATRSVADAGHRAPAPGVRLDRPARRGRAHRHAGPGAGLRAVLRPGRQAAGGGLTLAEAPMGPDERVFWSHLEAGLFQSAVDRGRWRLLSIAWPHAVIAIRTAERPGGPAEYALRFECSYYPQTPPPGQPWDPERNAPLEHARWPGGRSRIPLAFNPGWKGGQCLQLRCDRVALDGHDGWRSQHPSMICSPAGDTPST